MFHASKLRFLALAFALLAFALPTFADDVTISGTTTFAALDGSSLDHDGAANGVFTVDDGNLTVLGTINCNDSGAGNNSACAMSFAVSGNVLLESGSAIFAENRNGGGSGGDITFNAGGNFTMHGTALPQAGAVISSSRTANGNPGTSRAGFITINAGGAFSQAAGAVITAASQSDIPTKIDITAETGASIDGAVLAGPNSTIAGTSSTGTVFTGGSNNSSGGNITITSTSGGSSAVVVASSGIVATQGETAAGHVVLEGCSVAVSGLVASVAGSATGASVTARSATSIVVNGRVRADSVDNSASTYSVNLYAAGDIQIAGPNSGSVYAVSSNGGAGNDDASGTVNVISTGSTVTATGNAIAASNTDSGDQGGTIAVSAKGNVALNTASLNASGDFTTNDADRSGGDINVRSYSGSVSWNNGVGDVRPTGSAVAVAQRGTITLTHCTGVSTSGSSFPTNGAPVGPFPTIVNSCSPAAPSLPLGEETPDCNDPPVANNDAYNVNEGGTLNVAAPGVLGNDTDADGDPITATLVVGPIHAQSFTFNADGSFSYTHDGSETTTDSFTYTASDGMATSNTATVNITINPVNDVPVAADDAYNVDEGGTLNVAAPGVLVNDTDPDGPSMNAVLVSGPTNESAFVLNANGSFSYTHDGSETTSDSFTYRVNDGLANSNVATVNITINPINDVPVAVNDAYNVNEGGTVSDVAPGVLGNDIDADSTLTATLVDGPDNAQSFTFNADGSFSYTHDGSETTSDSFTYTATDGSGVSNVATVTITITAVNDAPVAVNDSYNVDEGGTITEAAPGVLGNDSDADGPSMNAVLVSGPANASSFALNADGSFTYTHNGSETTSDSFTYKVNDTLTDSNVATVFITINPVNDVPVAVADSYNVQFHGTLNVAAPGVLGNDTDPDGPSQTAVLVTGVSFGNLTFPGDGSFIYTHTGATFASDSFTYKVNDGIADSNTVTVTINITNEVPVANNDSYTAIGNTELRVGTGAAAHPAAVVSGSVLANDTDADNGPSPLSISTFDTVSAAGGSVFMNADGTFNYLPPVGFTGIDTFNYTASDGIATDVGTVTITVIERVWYVNPAAGGTQTGRSTQPFATIGQAEAASAINDYIHVAQGAQATGITLKNGQRLIGSGVALVVAPYSLAGATVRPTLNGTVFVEDGNLVTGLNVAGAGDGISANGDNNGTIAEVGVTSGGDGIEFTNATGTFTLTNVALTPGARGLAISGGTATVAASNLDVTTTNAVGIIANAGTLNISAGSDGSTVSTSNALAIDLSNATLNVSLLSVSASSAVNGIKLDTTSGSFTVTGSGSAGSGGTILNTTGRGASLVHAGSVSLSYMNFTNTSSTNGALASTCGNTFAGTNLGCNAAIHLQGNTSASLSNVNVTGSAQIGINGNGVANLTMSSVSVTGAGNETLEHGVQFVNLSGTGSITNSTFSNNFHRQFTVQNDSGTLSLSVTGSTFSSNGAATGAQGVLISGHGTANITTNVQTSNFTNNFSTGYFSDGADTAALDVTVSNNTFTNNGGGAVSLGIAGASTLEFDIIGNTQSGGVSAPISVQRTVSGTGAASGTISTNTLGLAGVPSSACSSSSCDGILINAGGSGAFTTAIDSNIIRNFNSRGISVNATNSAVLNAAVRSNTISQPGPAANNGIFVQSGTISTDTCSVCADINSNTISGTYGSGMIRVRNRFPTTTFRLPGYLGAGNDTLAVQAFLTAQNGGATATATINGNTFGGGPLCVAP